MAADRGRGLDRLPGQRLGQAEFAAGQPEVACRPQDARPLRWRDGQSESTVYPVQPLLDVATRPPEDERVLAQAAKRDRPGRPLLPQPRQRATQVGVLDLEAIERTRLVGQGLRDVEALDEVGVVRRVLLPRR